MYNCTQCNNIMATSQPRHIEQHFRETGKFKPIVDHSQSANDCSSANFVVQLFQRVSCDHVININEACYLWRIYFEETLNTYTEDNLKHLVLYSLDLMQKSNGFDENSELFANVGSLLLERVREKGESYRISSLDYNCVVVKMLLSEDKYSLDVSAVDSRPPIERDFAQEISVKIRNDFSPFYLLQRNKMLYFVKSMAKSYPILELTEHNLEESSADVEKQSLIIKNLSGRIVALKFQEENFNKSNEPLLILVPNKEVYFQILYKINRIKYFKNKAEEAEIKETHSFDNNVEHSRPKENKTTPDKNRKQPINKISMLSTNAVDEYKQDGKKKIILVSQPRHLKISQRVATNPKESNLVPSEIDYPVSMKDEKEKENPYFDEFENLLYEEQGGDEKQLALNDSFEEFQKREHSEKNLEIMKELNKRKEKETEEKKLLDSLKQKIKELIAEEKDWINKNLKLKSDIKRLKTPETPDQIKEIDEVKQKIGELKGQQRALYDQLAQIKKNNCIETLVYGEGPQESSHSQRGKDKIFHSINNMPVLNANFNPLTTSVRSNTGISSKFPTSANLQMSTQGNSPPFNNLKVNRSNFPSFPSPNPIYSSIPTQSLIQQYPGTGYLKPNQSPGINNNDHMGYQQRSNMHNHPNSVPFTSAIFASGGRMCLGSPLGSKKASVQAFPTGSNNKN